MNLEIRTSNPDMALAIAEGAATVELQAVKSECTRLAAINGVRREADQRRWEKTRRRLARKYSIRPVGRVHGAILGLWALVWLTIDGLTVER